MSPVWPKYEEGSLALISSVAAYFGAPTGHRTLSCLDRLLETGKYRNVIMLLYDGMAIATLKQHLPENSFLRTHVLRTISASYPSTTTAATTTLETGLSPAEHAWLGWSVYFPEIDEQVELFTNRNALTMEKASVENAGSVYMPYMSIFEKINTAGQARAAMLSPFSDPPYRGPDEILPALIKACQEPGRHYFYSYFGDPDHTMHLEGVTSPEVTRIMREIDEKTAAFAAALPADTLLLVTADHGLVDAEHLYIEDHPALQEAFLRPHAVESRAAAMYVKEEYRERFPQLFEEAFPGRFLLMTGEEAIESGLFGPGDKHPRLAVNAGDYMALSLDNACLQWKRKDNPLKGVHAGMTADEMLVPLIVYGAGLP